MKNEVKENIITQIQNINEYIEDCISKRMGLDPIRIQTCIKVLESLVK